MAVKIVTDSLSDITSDLAQQLGITVVPLTVSFGRESFLDRVTITTDEFYRRLSTGSIWPTTTQPPPGSYAEVYNKLAQETDEILVITVSRKLSGTYESASGARNMFKGKCRIEVIDCQTVVMGEGTIVINAAKAANAGMKLDKLADMVRKTLPLSHAIMYFDTLKYLAKGGRIGKAQGLLGSVLSVKPILTMRDGEVFPITRVRSRAAGMEYLTNFAANYAKNIAELAVEHATTPEEADELVKRLKNFFPEDKIYRATVSPVIGTYAGPNVLAICILEKLKE